MSNSPICHLSRGMWVFMIDNMHYTPEQFTGADAYAHKRIGECKSEQQTTKRESTQ